MAKKNKNELPEITGVEEENIHELYNGEVKIKFYPKSHRYKLVEFQGEKENRWIPSVTTILGNLDKSAALIPWAVRMFEERVHELMGDGANFTRDDLLSMLSVGKNAHNEKKESAATVGSVVHEYAEKYDENHELHPEAQGISTLDSYQELSDEEKELAENGALSFQKWYSSRKPVYLAKELLVYSIIDEYVGIADGVVKIGDEKYLLDYKTSKDVYTSHLYQVCAYAKAYHEQAEEGKRLDGVIILHLDKKTGEVSEYMLSIQELTKQKRAFLDLLNIHKTEKITKDIIKQAKQEITL